MTARLRIRKDPDSPPWIDGGYMPWEIDFMEPKEPGETYPNYAGLDTHDRVWSGSLAFATFAEAVDHIADERAWCLERVNDPHYGHRWYRILAALYGTDEHTMRAALHTEQAPAEDHGARRSVSINS